MLFSYIEVHYYLDIIVLSNNLRRLCMQNIAWNILTFLHRALIIRFREITWMNAIGYDLSKCLFMQNRNSRFFIVTGKIKFLYSLFNLRLFSFKNKLRTSSSALHILWTFRRAAISRPPCLTCVVLQLKPEIINRFVSNTLEVWLRSFT